MCVDNIMDIILTTTTAIIAMHIRVYITLCNYYAMMFNLLWTAYNH